MLNNPLDRILNSESIKKSISLIVVISEELKISFIELDRCLGNSVINYKRYTCGQTNIIV